jgi:hypothetical protein
MFASLLKTDKAPFILAVTLSLLGWFLTTTISNLSEVIVIGLKETHTKDGIHFTISNHSIKHSLANAVLSFSCAKDPCLEPIDPSNQSSFALERAVPPYAIQGNNICASSAKNFIALATLPPSARIRYEIKTSPSPDVIFTYWGQGSASSCSESGASFPAQNIWILPDASPTLWLIKNYNTIFIVAFSVTLAFLIYILFGAQPSIKGGPYDT